MNVGYATHHISKLHTTLVIQITACKTDVVEKIKLLSI